MSTDRKLLELAAKAAGLKIHTKAQAERDAIMDPEKASLWLACGTTAWNPITNDGDALRLFTKLPFRELYVSEIGATVRWTRDGSIHGMKCDEYASEHGGDLNAATRLAIVRAAAEIGKAMP